jgi:antitoxin component YwqK of YwqJK toxin-antitoxin module
MKLLILLITVFLIACTDNTIDESELVVRNDIHYQINSNKPFTGSVTSYHENGQKKNMVTYKRGLKDGLSEESLI